MDRSKQGSRTSVHKMSRASNQSGAASDGVSDSPPRAHVSDRGVDRGNEPDIEDINPSPSGLVPISPAAELGTGQTQFNGGDSATIRLCYNKCCEILYIAT